MATVFKAAGRKLYHAKIRVLLPDGSPDWKKIPTGCKDRSEAMAVAVAAERAIGAGLDRARAEALVATLMSITGTSGSIARPSLLAIGNDLFEGRAENIGSGTRRKYSAHWKRFQRWAGERISWAVDQWEQKPELVKAYYKDLRSEFSDTTANNHLTTLSMIFLRARAAGHIRGNPVELVERVDNDSVPKEAITRGEMAKLLRLLHRLKERAWCALSLLGWHLGHRIQDVLSLTAERNLKHQHGLWTLTFAPAKRKGKKGARVVVLPIPRYVARKFKRLKDFTSLHDADNRKGQVSAEWIAWLRRAGIDPLPVKRGKRTIHLKSFHSTRHAMQTRLTAAGVGSGLARLVTDHASERTQNIYVHAEITAIDEALKKARRK